MKTLLLFTNMMTRDITFVARVVRAYLLANLKNILNKLLKKSYNNFAEVIYTKLFFWSYPFDSVLIKIFVREIYNICLARTLK
jgi:hypothetical protein